MSAPTSQKLPRYPIYVPSKGRYENCLTAKFLVRDRVPFYLVIRPEEDAEYRERFGEHSDICTILHLDPKFEGPETRAIGLKITDGLIYARNWIRDHAELHLKAKRHLQFDDNIRHMRRVLQGKRVVCRAGVGIRALEDFSDRFSNVALSGFNYEMFVTPSTSKPFVKNCHVYSATLVNHAAPFRWREKYNDDTDICLQALSAGWCTILFNAFMVTKLRTMVMGGGNTADLYQDDGRLVMSRSLERNWPGVVTTTRRFKRPQHKVAHEWKRFDTPLIRAEGAELDQDPDRYKMRLRAVGDVKSPLLKKMLAEQDAQE